MNDLAAFMVDGAVLFLVFTGISLIADHRTPPSDGEGGEREVKNRRLVHERRIHGSSQQAPKPSNTK